MGNRLSKIVTRTGDAGTTGLADGSRLRKDSPRIETLGEIDELNSCLGVLTAEVMPEAIRNLLTGIQNDLFDLGGELCLPGTRRIDEAHITRLESLISRFNDPLPPLKEFILPGGTRASALAHLSRTVCRRAERRLISLAEKEAVSEPVRQYMNRLSDLLFVLGRELNRCQGRADVLWRPGPEKSSITAEEPAH